MKSNNFSTVLALALVSMEESLRTLKGTEPGDTILVVHEHGQITLQSVVTRVGHRGRQNGHIELRLMNIGTQGMVDHLLYDTLPAGFVSVMKVQLPRRAEKSVTVKASKTAVVARPSQSESREVVAEATQEAQQLTETAVVAQAQAVAENVAEEPIVAEVEAAVAEEARDLVEALTASVAPQEPQAEAVGGEDMLAVVVAQEDQPLSFVSVTSFVTE